MIKTWLDILKESKTMLAKNTGVEPIQTNSCSITVKYGGYENELNLPFSVNVTTCAMKNFLG